MLASIIIGGLLILLVIYCIRSLAGGKSSCGVDCSGCGGSCGSCGQCGTDKNALEEVRRQVAILKSEAVAVCCDEIDCVNFERADFFRISFVKDGQILGTLVTSSGMKGTRNRIEMLKSCTVNQVVCRGIGAGARHQLEAAGIQCSIVNAQSRDEALSEFIAA